MATDSTRLDLGACRVRRSEGPGIPDRSLLAFCGSDVVIEDGVRIFHPENVFLGDRAYIGHDTILKAYHLNTLRIAEDTWIGQSCFFHSAGGIDIGRAVGIGPGVKILTSTHEDSQLNIPILHHPIRSQRVIVEDGADIGIGSVILPGVTVGQGAIIGAGSVVTGDIPAFAIVAGVPARVIRFRTGITS